MLVQSGSNVLILDEPTNHLDLESREALESALQVFPGALLLISHDRALLDAVGTRTIAIEDQTLHSYVGGWPEYVRVREERAELEREAKRAKPPAAPKPRRPRPRDAEADQGAGEGRRVKLEARDRGGRGRARPARGGAGRPDRVERPALGAEVDAQARRGEGARRAALRAARGRRGLSAPTAVARGPGGVVRPQRWARLIDIPSSTFATVSQASTDSSSVSKMSFQRISIIGSMPFAKSEATAARTEPVALVLQPVDLDEVRREVGAVAQPAQRGGDVLGARDEHVGDLLRLLHRRLDAVEPELVGGLLGVVDDVVERARERVHVGRVERRAAPFPLPASRCRMSWAMRSPSCSQSRMSRASAPARGSPRAGRAAAASSAGRCARTPRRARAARDPASASRPHAART